MAIFNCFKNQKLIFFNIKLKNKMCSLCLCESNKKKHDHIFIISGDIAMGKSSREILYIIIKFLNTTHTLFYYIVSFGFIHFIFGIYLTNYNLFIYTVRFE